MIQRQLGLSLYVREKVASLDLQLFKLVVQINIPPIFIFDRLNVCSYVRS